MFFGRGLDFGSCRFWAEGENPCIFTVFLLFFIKSAKACEANFHRCWLQFLWQPEPKKEPFWLEIYKVFWFSEKKSLFSKPLLVRGGGGQAEPQETQKRPNHCIFTVFSCLAENQKKGLATGSQEAKLGTFWGPKSQGEALYLHFYSVFSSWQAENLHFYRVLGLWDTCREQPGTQRERKKHNFTCIFAGFWCLGWIGERVMDLGKIGKMGLGNLGSGILGNHKKGGIYEGRSKGPHFQIQPKVSFQGFG